MTIAQKSQTRLAQALWWPPWLSDCDEAFNYWEPVHYLQFGRGWQTWEYAPAYAIRSWLYAAGHALLGAAASAGCALMPAGWSSAPEMAPKVPFSFKIHELYICVDIVY